MTTPAFLRCEILAPERTVASDLAAIAQVCASDLGVILQTQKRIGPGNRPVKSTLILHLSVDSADPQNPVWCLACRLACFCPKTRVSVLVHSENAFIEPSQRPKRRKSA